MSAARASLVMNYSLLSLLTLFSFSHADVVAHTPCSSSSSHHTATSQLPCQGAQNMCDCAGFLADTFKPEIVVFASASEAVLDGYPEGTCGYANAACDLKWTVLCCDQGELAPASEASDFQPVEASRSLQTTFETAEDFCERNGFTLTGVFDVNRIAYPGDGFVGTTGYLDGTCGNVLASSMSKFSQCCCADEAYCCPRGEESDDCLVESDGDELGSYSYSFTPETGMQLMCPSTEGLDLSVCLEGGEHDQDCCASPMNASCMPGYVLHSADASPCDNMGSVMTCCYNNCTDSTSWHKNGEPSKDCAWVSEFTPQRCDVKGADRSLASYSCPSACSSPCHDSADWYKNGETSKTCAWVSSFPLGRCDVKGWDGTLASYACPNACGSKVMEHDSEDWYKTNEPSKDCGWVSIFASARCDAKGWDGSFAYEACVRACDGVAIDA